MSRPALAAKIARLQHLVDQTGQPGVIHGLTDACVDCTADADLTLLPGGHIIAEVYHDNGCPALLGAVDWQPEG